jgi:predicted MFS family arabinose efflux permease
VALKGRERRRLTDVGRILAAQGLRAAAYGFGAVLLGVVLEGRGWSGAEVGALLAALVAGTAITSVLVAAYGERLGRRRFYGLLYLGLALAGAAFATTGNFALLAAVALTGTLSTEVVESGPFTSLEQAMLAESTEGDARSRVFGTYNAVATLAGAGGALLAGAPRALGPHWFAVFVPIALLGAVLARSLSPAVEAPPAAAEAVRGSRFGLSRSGPVVARLSGLFAVDSFGGGFVVQAFIAYWLRRRFGASPGTLGAIFAAIGLLQAVSFLLAGRLASRFGLLNTMVFTHLPSNLLLAAVPAAPTLPVAAVLLFARSALSQMDVPTRQAYVMALVDPGERTAAAAWTNSVRYAVRPLGPVLGGALTQVALGAPFVVAGTIKSAYDLALWRWFRRVPLAPEA